MSGPNSRPPRQERLTRPKKAARAAFLRISIDSGSSAPKQTRNRPWPIPRRGRKDSASPDPSEEGSGPVLKAVAQASPCPMAGRRTSLSPIAWAPGSISLDGQDIGSVPPGPSGELPLARHSGGRTRGSGEEGPESAKGPERNPNYSEVWSSYHGAILRYRSWCFPTSRAGYD
jgi:hypothetical protein